MLHAGEIIDNKFQLLEGIGSGERTIVFKAEELESKRNVAIKLFSLSARKELDEIKSTLKEVKKTKKLDDGSFVKIRDAGVHKEMVYFSMDYLTGVSLEDTLKGENDRVWIKSLETLNKYFETLLNVYKTLKAKNLAWILMPEHVFRNDQGDLKLTGLTQSLRSDGSVQFSSFSANNVSSYLPPEMINGRYCSLDKYFQFAVAALMISMVNGEFYDKGRLSGSLDKMPRKFAKLKGAISKALEHDPRKRFRNFEDFSNEAQAGWLSKKFFN